MGQKSINYIKRYFSVTCMMLAIFICNIKVCASSDEFDIYNDSVIGVSKYDFENAIDGYYGSSDFIGSDFKTLRLKAVLLKNGKIKLSWRRTKGIKEYLIYSAGPDDRYAKLITLSNENTTHSIKGYTGSGYQRYFIIGVSEDDTIKCISKISYVCGKNSKFTNIKKLTLTNVNDNKLQLKAGDTFKMKIKKTKQNRKLKIKKYRGIAYESSNENISTVSTDGVITAISPGTCNLFVYAQNGVRTKIKVNITSE